MLTGQKWRRTYVKMLPGRILNALFALLLLLPPHGDMRSITHANKWPSVTLFHGFSCFSLSYYGIEHGKMHLRNFHFEWRIRKRKTHEGLKETGVKTACFQTEAELRGYIKSQYKINEKVFLNCKSCKDIPVEPQKINIASTWTWKCASYAPFKEKKGHR